MFLREDDISNGQAFITAEKCILFEVDNFSPLEGLISLISTYYDFYVSYPKSPPAAGLLLFIQEVLLDQTKEKQKKTAKYVQLVNAVLSD